MRDLPIDSPVRFLEIHSGKHIVQLVVNLGSITARRTFAVALLWQRA